MCVWRIIIINSSDICALVISHSCKNRLVCSQLNFEHVSSLFHQLSFTFCCFLISLFHDLFPWDFIHPFCLIYVSVMPSWTRMQRAENPVWAPLSCGSWSRSRRPRWPPPLTSHRLWANSANRPRRGLLLQLLQLLLLLVTKPKSSFYWITKCNHLNR